MILLVVVIRFYNSQCSFQLLRFVDCISSLQVRNFQIQEERRRSQVEEGERLEEVKERPLKELEDNTPDLKDSAKRYKFS